MRQKQRKRESARKIVRETGQERGEKERMRVE